MREHHGQQFTDLVAPFHTRLETAFATEATLGVQYRPQIDSIAADQQQAENGLLKKLTEEAIKAEEVKTCFMLD